LILLTSISSQIIVNLDDNKSNELITAAYASDSTTTITTITSIDAVYNDDAVDIFPVMGSENASEIMLEAFSLVDKGEYETAIFLFSQIPKDNAEYPRALFVTANLFASLGKYEAAISVLDEVLKINPQFAEAHIIKGTALADLGRYDEAIFEFDKATASNSISAILDLAWYEKGSALTHLGRYDAAIEAYNQALSFKPDYFDALYQKGNILYNLSKHEEALEAYERAISTTDDENGEWQEFDAWYSKARTLDQLGRVDEAIEAYDEALELNPSHADAWFEKAVISFNRGSGYEQEAIEAFNNTLNLEPYNFDALIHKGISEILLGQYNQSYLSFDYATILDPEHAYAWTLKGESLMELGRYEEAIQAYDEALQLSLDDPSIVWNSKGIALAKLGKYENATLAFDEAINTSGDYDEPWNNKGTALVDYGKVLADSGQLVLADQKFNEAIAAYDKALEINHYYFDALMGKGSALFQLGNYSDSIKVYDGALVLRPNYAEALNDKGTSLAKMGEYTQAYEAFSAAINNQPDYLDPLYNQGNVLSDTGDYSNAIDRYKRALNISTNDADTWNNIGLAYLMLGDNYNALVSFENAIKNGPDSAIPWNNIGLVYALDRITWNKSKEAFEKAISIDPNFLVAYSNLGMVLIGLQQYHEAIAQFDRVIDMNDTDVKRWEQRTEIRKDPLMMNLTDMALYGKGNALSFLRLDDDAMDAYDNASQQNYLILNAKGILLNNQDRYEEATGKFNEGIKWIENELGNRGSFATIDPTVDIPTYEKNLDSWKKLAFEGSVDIYNNKGVALNNLGNPFGALAEYGAALGIIKDENMTAFSSSIENVGQDDPNNNSSTTSSANETDTQIIMSNKQSAENARNNLILSFLVAIGLGFGAWFTADKTLGHTTRFYFLLQKKSIMHFIPAKGDIKEEQYFVLPTKSQETKVKGRLSSKLRLISILLLVLATYMFLIEKSDDFLKLITFGSEPPRLKGEDIKNIFIAGSLPDANDSAGRGGDTFLKSAALIIQPQPLQTPLLHHLEIFRIVIWIMTFCLVSFFILPIDIIESSRARLHNTYKNSVSSITTPFQIIFSLAAITTIISIVGDTLISRTLGIPSHYMITILLTAIPLLPLFYMYFRSTYENALTGFQKFLSQRKTIAEKRLEVVPDERSKKDVQVTRLGANNHSRSDETGDKRDN
jgi:tetratricopeptide (TPR) repeat protein